MVDLFYLKNLVQCENLSIKVVCFVCQAEISIAMDPLAWHFVPLEKPWMKWGGFQMFRCEEQELFNIKQDCH